MFRNLAVLCAATIFGCIAVGLPAYATVVRLHYAAGGNFNAKGRYVPGKIGFNLADVSSVGQLDALPAGVRGLVWLGQCDGVDASFLDAVRPYAGKPNLFGFYLMDDPDRREGHSHYCAARKLKAEADWIHANVPGAKTFIVLMNLGTSEAPSFAGSYDPANSRIDLFGFSPYPCRTELKHCDFGMIKRYVTAAAASGIPRDRMVPVYQTFGGGGWRDDRGGRYVLPTARQERQILARWAAVIPSPVFDYAYSWGSQRGDAALQNASDLQKVFLDHNRAR